MSATRRIALAATIAASFWLTSGHVFAAEKDDIKCLNAVAKAVQKASSLQLKALHKCREGNANPAAAECPDTKAQKPLEKAQKQIDKLPKKCKEDKFNPQRAVGFEGCNASERCVGNDQSITGYLDCVGCITTDSSDNAARALSDGACGNNFVDPGEECDDGGETATCDANCRVPCDCCALNPRLAESTIGIGSGVCGTLRKFGCQGEDDDFQDVACSSDTDCEVGPCITAANFCTGNPSIACSSDADCNGTCQEVTTGGFPQDLECGTLYTGGGNNSVPLPLSIPDQSNVFFGVTACNPDGTTVLGPATAADIGGTKPERKCTEGRKCSGSGAACVVDANCPASQTCDDKCLFGAPLPVPNPNSTPTSVCVLNVVAEDASGSGTCDGDSVTEVPLRSVIYLAGDILSTATGPVTGGVPGIQSCPLCSAQCVGGTNMDQPCAMDADCPGSTCDGTTNCIGGPSTGNPCTPETSRLNDGFPTSHDCPPLSSQDITTAIGGLPIAFELTTGTVVKRGVDQSEQRRTFCGFCRDVNVEGSGCFDGDPDPGMVQGCPDSGAQAECAPASGSTTGCGTAVPCTSDGNCAAPYESCAQRNPGAFSKSGATVYSLSGTPSGCLADGEAHDLTGVSAFCIPPTFDSTVDAAGDLPGPGAVSLDANIKLIP